MHKRHLTFCAAGVVLALAFIVVAGPSTGGLGVLAATLVCPLAMVVAVRVLMGSRHVRATRYHDQVDTAPERRQLDARATSATGRPTPPARTATPASKGTR